MNILIVDDEPRHLRGMAAMLRAMRPDADVATAKDGEAALAAVRDARPDVVLSDIQMPNMDGLAFLRRLEEEDIATKVVMVSAYDLFAYAQTALRHGAYDYLLKPVDAEKVEALLERLEAQLAAEREAQASSDALRQRLREASPAYRSRQLHRWLAGELPPDEGAGLAEWPALQAANVLVLTEAVRGDGAEADGAAAPEPPPLEELAERLALAASAFGDACAFALQTEPAPGARLVTALRLARPAPEARRALRGALLAVAEAWRPRGALAHGIAALPPEPPDAGPPRGDAAAAAPGLYRRAQQALAYAFHAEWRGAVDADDVLPPAKPVFRLDGEQLFEALQEPEPAAAEALCAEAFRELAAGGRCEPRLMKDYAALTLMKLKSRTRDIIDTRVGSVVTETAVSDVPACRSAEALIALLLGSLREVHKSLHERKQGRSELIVDQCLGWIQERFAEDLTLEAAAERFHFNASYFSTLLKARTGRSFSEHVTDARIRRAKELLLAGQLRIYEIAEQCGYRDTKYFTRMFKRQVGLSPEAYKHAAPRANEGGETP